MKQKKYKAICCKCKVIYDINDLILIDMTNYICTNCIDNSDIDIDNIIDEEKDDFDIDYYPIEDIPM